MLIITINLIMNVLLNYLFTIVLDWGVEGLAYSTMGVFPLGFLISCYPLSKNEYFHLSYPRVFDKRFLSAFGHLTWITSMIFLSVAIFSISSIILNRIAIGISTDALIVFAIYCQIMGMIIITTRGLAGGYIIYLGNAIRDKKAQEYFPIYWAATAWNAIANMIGVILFLTIPNQLIGLFENVDLILYEDIRHFLVIGAIILVIYTLPRMSTIGFISINKSILLVLNSLIFVLVQIIAAYYLTEYYGMQGLVLSELVSAVLVNSLFFPVSFII